MCALRARKRCLGGSLNPENSILETLWASKNTILEALMAQELRSWTVLGPKRPQERKEPPKGRK
eukprot:10219433-Karenia_brevis.AAC.1